MTAKKKLDITPNRCYIIGMKRENDIDQRITEIQKMIDEARLKFSKRAEDTKEQKRIERSES